MMVLMDKFFVRIGLDKVEISAAEYRGLIYIGMIFMLGVAVAFLVMAAFV